MQYASRNITVGVIKEQNNIAASAFSLQFLAFVSNRDGNYNAFITTLPLLSVCLNKYIYPYAWSFKKDKIKRIRILLFSYRFFTLSTQLLLYFIYIIYFNSILQSYSVSIMITLTTPWVSNYYISWTLLWRASLSARQGGGKGRGGVEVQVGLGAGRGKHWRGNGWV